MRFGIYRKYGARNSPPVFDAVEAGLRQLGHTPVPHDDHADVAVIWSQLWAGTMQHNQKIFEAYRRSSRPVLVIEVGALHRNLTWRFLLNGEHRLLTTNQGPERAQNLGIQLRDWRRTGQHVLIAMQRADSQQWQGMPDANRWLDDVVTRLRRHTDREIVIRPHPRSLPRLGNTYTPPGCHIQLPNHIANTYDNFDFDQGLSQAWAVVNWNSNPGVVALINGVPAFVGASSLAAAVANLDLAAIEAPAMPDRTEWFHALAWHEWLVEEIAQGQALEPSIAAINDRA